MTGAPGGDRRAATLAAEQAAVDLVHDRVEVLRERALARSLEAGRDHTGATFQDAFQRDVVAHHHAARAAQLSFGDFEQVVFGRLDDVDGDTWRVGRTSVIDEEGDVLLVDWRADAAVPFYRATAADPHGVARRRRYVAQGPRIRDLDDELLDVAAADELGLDTVAGQGALLAALERVRTGRMRDIVATIQADQDRIIRAPEGGTLVVTGGPGTGKTVVALHRVAYLLHAQRERFTGRGVLVVGPSRAFSTYVERVLPALGEDSAVLRSVDAFVPHGVTVEGWDDPDVAAVTGSMAMVEVLRRLLGASLPALPPATSFTVDDVTATVSGRELARVRRRLLGRVEAGVEGRRYHDRDAAAEDALRAALWSAWAQEARRERPHVEPDRRGVRFDELVEDHAAIELTRRCFWPPRSPVRVLGSLVDGEVDLAALADGLLTPAQVATVRAAWDGRRQPTGDDVALLDELDALLGPHPDERRRSRRRGADDGGLRVGRDGAPVASDEPLVGTHRYDAYAHVVVDEAQDLSPMQWRMVARRGPDASWTVVGDLAQRARTAEPRTWDEVAGLIGRRRVSVRSLTVNYRTPEEVVAVAQAVLAAAGEDPALAPTSVREAGRRPRLLRRADVEHAALEAARAALSDTQGTVAVLAPDDRVPTLAAALADAGDRCSVLDVRTAKGLEFDEVVVVAPDEIVAANAVGGHALYVAVTRTTSGLTLVAAPDATVPGAELCDAED